MTMKLTASGGVLAALAAISVAFNRWIDGREVEAPGETSVQVAVGTGYTLLGAALLVWLWRGWREALRLVVCADIEEVWRDEYECIRQRCSVLLDERNELQRQLEQLQRVYVADIALADALEAECIHLRRTINESSAATGVSMAQCEPDASSTSSTAEPMPAGEGESIGERKDGEEPVSSAPTSKRRGRQGRSTPKPGDGVTGDGVTGDGVTQEVGKTTSPDFIDWRQALTDLLPAETINRLETETGHRWSRLEKATQKNLVFRIAETIYARTGTISQSLYDSNRPYWATDVSSWTKTTDLRWRDVLNHLQVEPSTLPLASRTVRSAMS